MSLYSIVYIDGLVQERRNSIANALELCVSGTNPSIWSIADMPHQQRHVSSALYYMIMYFHNTHQMRPGRAWSTVCYLFASSTLTKTILESPLLKILFIIKGYPYFEVLFILKSTSIIGPSLHSNVNKEWMGMTHILNFQQSQNWDYSELPIMMVMIYICAFCKQHLKYRVFPFIPWRKGHPKKSA